MIDGIVRSVETFARIDSIVIPDLNGTPEILKVKYLQNPIIIPLTSHNLADDSEGYN